MRGTNLGDPLPFDPEIERTALRNKRQVKKKKHLAKKQVDTSTSITSTPSTNKMAEADGRPEVVNRGGPSRNSPRRLTRLINTPNNR